MPGISLLADGLLASLEGLCSVDLLIRACVNQSNLRHRITTAFTASFHVAEKKNGC
jgi:hypothetical protein